MQSVAADLKQVLCLAAHSMMSIMLPGWRWQAADDPWIEKHRELKAWWLDEEEY